VRESAATMWKKATSLFTKRMIIVVQVIIDNPFEEALSF
jgi:hypothetical protein